MVTLLNETLFDVGKMLALIEWPESPDLDEAETKQKWCDHIRDRAAGRPGSTFTHHEIRFLMCCDGRKEYLPADVCAILGLGRRTSCAASVQCARFEVQKREMMSA